MDKIHYSQITKITSICDDKDDDYVAIVTNYGLVFYTTNLFAFADYFGYEPAYPFVNGSEAVWGLEQDKNKLR